MPKLYELRQSEIDAALVQLQGKVKEMKKISWGICST